MSTEIYKMHILQDIERETHTEKQNNEDDDSSKVAHMTE